MAAISRSGVHLVGFNPARIFIRGSFVDAKYRFIWASCGFSANSHDSVILQSTTLWQQIKEVDFIPKLENTKWGDVSTFLFAKRCILGRIIK